MVRKIRYSKAKKIQKSQFFTYHLGTEGPTVPIGSIFIGLKLCFTAQQSLFPFNNYSTHNLYHTKSTQNVKSLPHCESIDITLNDWK